MTKLQQQKEIDKMVEILTDTKTAKCNKCDLVAKYDELPFSSASCYHCQVKNLFKAGYRNLKEVLAELLQIVNDAAINDCQVTIDANDIIKLAKRYNIEITN